MQRIKLIAPSLSDAEAIDLIRDLAREGYSVDAKGPLYGEGDDPDEGGGLVRFEPDVLSPADRKAFYESELSRIEFEKQSGRFEELPEQHPAPTGWYIIAMRGEA